jgi:S1-C subfamily serine protease
MGLQACLKSRDFRPPGSIRCKRNDPCIANRDILNFDDAPFKEIPLDWGGISASVVPVIHRRGARIQGLGTAFCIAVLADEDHVVFLTARHVVEHLKASTDLEPFVVIPLVQDDADSPLVCAAVVGIGMANPFSDVAVLIVDYRSASKPVTYLPKAFPVTLRRPSKGDTCLAVGYTRLATEGEHWLEADASISNRFHAPLHGSLGKIEEVFETRRGGMVVYPSIQLDAYTEAGMSGGPILHPSGSVVGIVSTCLAESDSPPKGLTWAALMGTTIELVIPLPGDSKDARLTVGDVIREIPWTEPSTTALTRDDGGVSLSWPEAEEAPTAD